MQITLAARLADDPHAQRVAAALGRCVHCGFCLPACPTYALGANELDSPRGRIYLMKQLVEGAPASGVTERHLDRCLGCRACESACPSGVRYGDALDDARVVLAAQPAASAWRRLQRRFLAWLLPGSAFRGLLHVARAVAPLLTPALARRIGTAGRLAAMDVAANAAAGSRRVLLLAGCVQPALRPDINPAAERLLAAVGIAAITVPAAGCCGALAQHLDAHERALAQARANIDAWYPELAAGAEAIVSTASGCGAQLRDYARLLRDDPAYAARAAEVSARCRDLAELLWPERARLQPQLRAHREPVVLQAPCTSQHASRLGGVVESLLAELGVGLLPAGGNGACCGSAGAYSLLQPAIAAELRQQRLTQLLAPQPAQILSANIGCISHLAAASPVPVLHWAEWLSGQLSSDSFAPRAAAMY